MTNNGKRPASSLRNKILLAVNVLVLLALLIVTVVSNVLSSGIILQDSIRNTQNLLSLVLIRCRTIFDSALGGIDQLYNDVNLMKDIRDLEGGKLSGSAGERLSRNVEYSLFRLEAASEYIHGIMIITSGNSLYSHSVNSGLENLIELNSASFFETAHFGRGRAVFVRIQANPNYLLVCRALYGDDLNRPLLAVAVLLPVTRLRTDLQSFLREYAPYFELVDMSNNEVMISYGRSYFDSESFFSEIDDIYLKTAGVYEDRLLKVLISFRDLGGPEWRAVLAVPKKVLYAKLYRLSLIQFFISLTVLLLVSLSAVFLSRGIVRPLQLLVLKLKQFEESPAKMNLETNRTDEIGYLYRTMNRMSERLDHLINMVYREQLNRKDAELKALQAQINPHFLFNTLETISWKARLEGSETASDMITALSQMLHVNIGREGRDIISINEEIDYLENYFFLQKTRHEDKIEFTFSVPEALMQRKLPSLSLQPVAENAIFHNTPIRGILKIQLKGYLKKGKIYLEFRDNGAGVSEENRAIINDALSGAASYIMTDKERGRKSVGLVNVHRRIQLLYGDEYGMRFDKCYNGACVIICIPWTE